MEVHLTTEQESRLAELARDQGVSVDALLTDAALVLLDEDERERQIILQRIEQANRGEFIEEEEMDKRVKAMLARQ
jgi:predicted transcriptional regulator